MEQTTRLELAVSSLARKCISQLCYVCNNSTILLCIGNFKRFLLNYFYLSNDKTAIYTSVVCFTINLDYFGDDGIRTHV